MAVLTRDPWGESSFENLTQKAAATVKKTAVDVVKAVAADIKPQAGTDETGKGQTAAGQTVQPPVEDKKQQKLAETRQSLARINQEIVKARQERIKKYQESLKVKDKEKQEKKAEIQEKKKDDSVLMKLIKGKSGTREGIQRAGG